jgi:poly(hydroxyalkanoate) depolymerase family esterase
MLLRLVLAAAVSVAAPALSPNFTGTYGDASGHFSYVGYASTTVAAAPVPLVLVLHGCLEDPADFEAGSRWFEDAQAKGYVVVMPEHTSDEGSNPNGCFEYWNNHDRGRGEPATLAGLVASVEQKFPIDRTRVYVAGFSGGGGMAVALAADYPDIFAAIGVESGIEYQPCADNQIMHCYYALSDQHQAQDPDASGRAAYAQDRYTKAVPAIFFQGDRDGVVSPWNLTYLLRSYAAMNDGFISSGAFAGRFNATPSEHTTGQSPGGETYDTYVADNGLLQWTIVHGMGHAWSGGVSGRASNASDGNNYNDPKGPDATIAMRTFFFAHPR